MLQKLPSGVSANTLGPDSGDSVPMPSMDVVMIEQDSDLLPSLRHRFIRLEINLLAFQAVRYSLNENVVHPATFAVHADLNAMVLQNADKIVRRELGSLIRIENFRHPELRDRFFQCFDAERQVQRVR